MVSVLVPFLLGLLIAAGWLVPFLLRSRRLAGRAGDRALALEGEIAELRRGRTTMEEDQRSLARFLEEFPRLARELMGGVTDRQLPQALLHVLQKVLDPARAVVLIRRGREEVDPRFAVAAVAPEGAEPAAGTEVPFRTGAIGFVAESRLVASREDLAAVEVRSAIRPGSGGLPGLTPDLYAPLVFDQETLGMILLSRPRRPVGDGKTALRLIAQTAAPALHRSAAPSRPRGADEIDGLTRVFTRRHMEQSLSELIVRTTRAGSDPGAVPAGPSVLLLDVDHFQHYNDTNGHLPGDKLLQELARLIGDQVRRDDLVGRFGGEEFLLILPETTLSQALGAADKVRAAIAARRFPFAEKQPMGMVSISGGVAEYPRHGVDAGSLLRAADAALYEAKRQGRNRVVAAARPVPADPRPWGPGAAGPGAGSPGGRP